MDENLFLIRSNSAFSKSSIDSIGKIAFLSYISVIKNKESSKI